MQNLRYDVLNKNLLIDTNIIIRFITNDHPLMSPEVALLMKHAERGHITLKVTSMVIAECCWVLQSRQYNFQPADIADVLISFIMADGIEMEMEEKDIVIHALHQYARTQVDFVDAFLAALSDASNNQPIVTYNSKDFHKLNILHVQPSEATQ